MCSSVGLTKPQLQQYRFSNNNHHLEELPPLIHSTPAYNPLQHLHTNSLHAMHNKLIVQLPNIPNILNIKIALFYFLNIIDKLLW